MIDKLLEIRLKEPKFFLAGETLRDKFGRSTTMTHKTKKKVMAKKTMMMDEDDHDDNTSSSNNKLLLLQLSSNQQDILIKLESAIQLHLYYQYRSNDSDSNGGGRGRSGGKNNSSAGTSLSSQSPSQSSPPPSVTMIPFSTFRHLASKIDGRYSNEEDIEKKTTTTKEYNSSNSNSSQNDDSNSSSSSSSDNHLSMISRMSREERIVHDFYCIAVPTMYDTRNKDDDLSIARSASMEGLVCMNLASSSSSSSATEGKNATNTINGNKNRFKELRRLIKDAVRSGGVSRSKSEEALRFMEKIYPRGAVVVDSNTRTKRPSHHQQQQHELGRDDRRDHSPSKKLKLSSTDHDGKENNQAKTKSSKVDDILGVRNGTKSSSSTTITKERISITTIEERIKARAKERERDLEEAKKFRLDPREERVAVTDALYGHACHLLRRQASSSGSSSNRFKSSSKSVSLSRFKTPTKTIKMSKTATSTTMTPATKTTKCILTFSDIVNVLSPRPRKEIARLLVDISNVSPGWITWTTAAATKHQDGGNSDSNTTATTTSHDDKKGINIRIPNDTKMVIETANYKHVRGVLNGRNLSSSNSGIQQGFMLQQQQQQQQQPQQQQRTPVPGTTKVAAVTISTKKYPSKSLLS